VKDSYPKLFVTDSCTSHLEPDIINDMKKKRVVVAVVPGGCTMYVQVLDVAIFSIFKNNYENIAEDYIEKHGPRSNIKLTASQSRILCTKFTWSAWELTLSNIDIAKAFRDIGYTWTDDSPVSLRSMPGYTFDPKSNEHLSSIDDEHTDDYIDKLAEQISQEQQRAPVKPTQMKLTSMWNKN
jgi:hypothetical protein